MALAFDEFGRPFIILTRAAAAAVPAPPDPGPSRSFRSEHRGAPCSVQGATMKLAFDEFGRPFIILSEEQEKQLVGPKHYMDKMLLSPDGDFTTITIDDGSTVQEQIEVDNLMIAKLIEMFHGQDFKIVDGDVDGGAEAPTVGDDEAVVVATAPEDADEDKN